MTESTPAIVTMLHGELGKAGEDEEAKLRVVQHTCKPVIRNLAKNYDEEDESANRRERAMAAKEMAEKAGLLKKYKAEQDEQSTKMPFLPSCKRSRRDK